MEKARNFKSAEYLKEHPEAIGKNFVSTELLDAGLFKTLWHMWPQDELLQGVAAKQVLSRLSHAR